MLPVEGAPDEDMVDMKRKIEDAAMAYAELYEQKHLRAVKNVTGEHKQYPYDFYSSGPGGPRSYRSEGDHGRRHPFESQ